MIPEQVVDNRAEAVALLTDKWREKPVTSELLKALVGPYDGIETAVWSVLNAFNIDALPGVWLDYLGAIVGEPREARDDTTYRAAIKVRIRINRSKGRSVDVLDVATLMIGTPIYREYRLLSWEVEAYALPNAGDIVRALTQTKAATSYGVLKTLPSTTDCFKWCHSGAATPADNQKWGSVYVP